MQASEQLNRRYGASTRAAHTSLSLFTAWRDSSIRIILGALLALLCYYHRKKLKAWMRSLAAARTPAEATGFKTLIHQRQQALLAVKKAADSGAPFELELITNIMMIHT